MTDPNETLAATADLGPLVETYGPKRLEPADDLFQRMVTSVCNQQVSTAAGRSIRESLFDAVRITPSGVRAVEEDVLREAGLSRQKCRYVCNIARWFESKESSRDRLAALSDEEVRSELTSITGVGDWTAKMTLVFGLGRPDVFPVEDLAIRRAMTAQFGDESRAAMRDRADCWQPYRSYAALYLWDSYEAN